MFGFLASFTFVFLLGYKMLIFDLDETVIDSRHRTPNNPDGSLNLPAYIEKHTRENVFKDKLLPLANTLKKAVQSGKSVVILTAREMSKADYDYLYFHGLANLDTLILSRDKASKKHYKMKDGDYKLHWLKKAGIIGKISVMFDDAKHVKQVLRRAGIVVICAHKANKKCSK